MVDFQKLSAVFPPNEIEWRVGSTNSAKTSGLALAYLTARHIMDRLDNVVGQANWQDRYEFHGDRTICYLSLRLGDEWVTKADGAGDSDVEAEKGAISDALKRAAVKWGIGRYLYQMINVWVEIEAAGKSFRIKKDEYPKLERALMKQFGGVLATGEAVTQHGEIVDTKPKTTSRADFDRLVKDIRSCAAVEELAFFWNGAQTRAEIDALPSDWRKLLIEEKDARKAELSTPKRVEPNFDDLPL